MKHGSIGEHIDPVKWTTTICFQVVGGQSWVSLSDRGRSRVRVSERFCCYQRSHLYSYLFLRFCPYPKRLNDTCVDPRVNN